MFYRLFKNTFFILAITLVSCLSGSGQSGKLVNPKDIFKDKNSDKAIVVGANQTESYLPLLRNKKIGIVGNQTSVIFKEDGSSTHLIDSLVSLDIEVAKAFSPEHGFRGKADAGESVKNGTDQKTGVPIISLYGNHKKPTAEDFKGIDMMVFDIQDVGARFYTYISTLHYVMEACAENQVPLLILDRPNPNGNYIDGPILEKAYESFVGMHPVPIVHGMTIGEYAQMVNGEKWLKNGEQCDLMVIMVENYTKAKPYSLPIKPSPNLPNDQSINLYPSLCFFEGTNVNAGRGTNKQFQVFGSPELDNDYYDFQYTPKPNDDAKHPKNEGKICYGKDLSQHKKLSSINLDWLINAYQHTAEPATFFNPFFSKLAGNKKLQRKIENGLSSQQIKATWQVDLQEYDTMRERYLLYPVE